MPKFTLAHNYAQNGELDYLIEYLNNSPNDIRCKDSVSILISTM